MKLPNQPTAKLSCLYQLLFQVKFLTVSTGHGEILPLFIPMPRMLPTLTQLPRPTPHQVVAEERGTAPLYKYP